MGVRLKPLKYDREVIRESLQIFRFLYHLDGYSRVQQLFINNLYVCNMALSGVIAINFVLTTTITMLSGYVDLFTFCFVFLTFIII
jgi:hypothetical protein